MGWSDRMDINATVVNMDTLWSESQGINGAIQFGVVKVSANSWVVSVDNSLAEKRL